MNKNRLCCIKSFFNELKDSVGGFVFLIKDDLVVLIEPEECQVGDSYGFPVVWDLLAGTVYYVSYFVCNDELEVLIQMKRLVLLETPFHLQ